MNGYINRFSKGAEQRTPSSGDMNKSLGANTADKPGCVSNPTFCCPNKIRQQQHADPDPLSHVVFDRDKIADARLVSIYLQIEPTFPYSPKRCPNGAGRARQGQNAGHC
jgi:hypothetical protein